MPTSSRRAVEVAGLSKRFTLGRDDQFGYRTLRDAISGWLRPRPDAARARQELWALRDVSFEVAEGEALGIIGHNGAGKSTLLKILSRITEPNAGRARLWGRVSSLLEVGTGFHPELTGRENIYLNGAILGMRRSEVRRAFDDIVAFAEIERFLDTPVKRYSSGMYVRLAFAVAAHLTSEILIIDEVLAVGDAEFQRRCLGRMSAVAHSGRTVLFVSHNLQAVEDLCPRTLLLRQGQVEQLGPTRDVITRYLARRAGEAQWDLEGFPDREGSGRARLLRLELLAVDAERVLEQVPFRGPFRVRLHYRSDGRWSGASVGLALLSENGTRLFFTSTGDAGAPLGALEAQGFLDCVVLEPNLLPGTYRLEAWINDRVAADFADHVRGVGQVEVAVADWRGMNVAALTERGRGFVHVPCEWRPGP